jgi:hypothetical protein
MKMKILSAFLVAAATAFAGTALAEPVGNVGAVNQSAEGNGRKLSVGAGVEARERITTDAKGSAQIVFRDNSTMTVGRGSSVTVNKFVYNGQQGVGEQSAKLTKGALRFVGGAVSHSEGAKIETPSGSLAVRGGMAYACLNCQQGPVFAALSGEVKLSNGTTTVPIQPGEMVRVEKNGTFSASSPIPQDLLKRLDGRFASIDGQHGGAIILPTDKGPKKHFTDTRMPDQTPGQTLDTLNAQWAGNPPVQGRAQANNQRSANTVRVLTTPPAKHGNPLPPCASVAPCGLTVSGG